MVYSQRVGHRGNFTYFPASGLGIGEILYDFKPVVRCNLGTDRILHESCLIN